MHIASKEHRFLSSSIVGGICPIALGVAFSLKLQNSKDKVYCFVGDMASRTGIFYESVRYAEGHDLPILFVVEDNRLSVDTPTEKVWGEHLRQDKIRYYAYEREYPHSGTGKWIAW